MTFSSPIKFLTAFAITIVLLGNASPALAASKKQVVAAEPASALEQATVNLYCRLKAGKTTVSSTGSGVFIHEKGVILTNAHVAQYFFLAQEKGRVTGWCSVRTGSPANEMYSAEVLYFPPTWLEENVANISKRKPKGTGENDFALLYVTSAKKGTLPTTFPSLPVHTASITKDTAIDFAGYPTGNLNFSKIRSKLLQVTGSSTVATIHSFTPNQTDVLTLAPTTVGTDGFSGGPMTTSSNSVAGIITSKSSSKGQEILRGITTTYIDRAILAQTGISLTGMLAENSTVRAAATKLLIPEDTLKALAEGLRKKK